MGLKFRSERPGGGIKLWKDAKVVLDTPVYSTGAWEVCTTSEIDCPPNNGDRTTINTP